MEESLQHGKYLTHAVPTCDRVKVMVKVWFSVLIYETLKTFMKTMKYTLFDVTITRLNFFTPFFIFKTLIRICSKVVKNVKTSCN